MAGLAGFGENAVSDLVVVFLNIRSITRPRSNDEIALKITSAVSL